MYRILIGVKFIFMANRTLNLRPNIVGPENTGRREKKTRICLRCNTNLTNKNKCGKCGLKFHDGLILSWLKKVLGISAR